MGTFPIVAGVPILLNESNSLFCKNDFIHSKILENTPAQSRLKKIIKSLIPSITHNWVAALNYEKVTKLLTRKNPVATVLVVGGGDVGAGLERLLDIKHLNIVETDVYLGPRTKLVADGHDLPFSNHSFDAVIVQAVLEHVLDPYRCVAEIHRVLKPEGLVYAETPFMYPVHLGPYDFTRFSLGGHRRLFRNFDQINGGVLGGPGMALALAVRSFFYSLSTSRAIRSFADIVLPFFTFWLKYVDYFLISKPHASDFASCIYFLGMRKEMPIPDKDIVEGYWSKNSTGKNAPFYPSTQQ